MTIKVMKNFDPGSLPFVCIGHRGACGYQPENTLSSFQTALEMGCPWIELDVYVVEGELIVIHDDTLERTTNGKGRVSECDLSYLRSLDAGEGQQIPTLMEVIHLVNHQAGINVELKGPETALPVSNLLKNLCQNGWSSEEFMLSSFDHRELAKADAGFRRGVLFHNSLPHNSLFQEKSNHYFEVTASLDAFSLNLNKNSVNVEIVKEAHKRGFKIYIYTVNEPADLVRMLALGVDGVFTNYPDRVFDLIEKD